MLSFGNQGGFNHKRWLISVQYNRLLVDQSQDLGLMGSKDRF
ncbi:hypothetical protein Sez_0918 [Streptococcus equi subsp. zooepidemicus MGCS10565]|uniref:Uncharacterized protein n=1 Tax=Streptococcus equi subsp. zooepidemicus (strain MGCS10565) TaxID=552526 RepID=B4U2Q9_STREM|nr:hypothetical protein Sez_0918 [Streptococcus equi subsp. zooepidemicus MGCS10565]